MKKLFSIIFACTLCLSIMSCSSPEYPDPEPLVYNMVTFEAYNAESTTATFTYQANGDSPLITLTALWQVPETVKPGMRLLLAYTPESNTTESGPVSLAGYAILPGGKPELCTTTPYSEAIRLSSLWRSGHYLNLHSTISLSGESTNIVLYVDQATLDTPNPQAYIAVTVNDSYVQEQAERTLYASWDISKIWTNPATETLSVTYTDIANKPQTIIFNK